MAFSSVNVDGIIDAMRQLPDNSSAADPIPETSRRLDCAILCQTVQSLAGCQLFSVWFQGGVHHTNRQESRPTLNWCQFTSADLQLVSYVKASWTHGCSSADGLLIICRSPSCTANLISDQVILLKPPASRSCRSYYKQSNLVIYVLWSSSIWRQPSTPSITTSCSIVCSRPLASTASK